MKSRAVSAGITRWWLGSLLFTAAAFGGIGYYLRDRQIHSPHTLPPAPAQNLQTQTTAPPPSPIPEQTGLVSLAPTKEQLGEPLDFDATAKAFLEAPDWKTRSRYVIIPDQVRDLMEERAKESGDGPVPVTSWGLAFIDHGNHTYSVRTRTMPDAIPLTVMPTEQGPKVDWESFIAFHEDDFRKFAEGPVGGTGIFHVIVRPDPEVEGGEDRSYFMRFRLSVPMPNREQTAWVAKKSAAMPLLTGIFSGGGGTFTKEQIDSYVSKGGLPMVLSLEKKGNGVGQDFLEITDFISLGWGPRPE